MKVDREIEDLLAVDHSPEFLARVRARVATEPAPVASWWSLKLVPMSAGLVALMAVAVLWPSSAPDIGSDVGLPVPLAAPVAEPLPAPVVAAPMAAARPSDAQASHAVAPAARRASTRADTAAAAPTLPRRAEIVISPEDGRAFRLLLARTREGVLVDLPVGRDDAVAGPPWIEIAPLMIEPLAQLAQDEGGRQ